MQIQRTIPRPRKTGFTLVELMVVILILIFLLGILIPITLQVLGVSREAATKATVKKLHELMQKRLDAFNRGFDASFKRQYGEDWQPATPWHVEFRKSQFRAVFLIGPAMTGSTPADNAEILYTLLKDVEGLGSSADDANEFGSLEVGDTDGDGNLEFLDGWGNPIRYYPYPTRLIKPDGHDGTAGGNGGVNLSKGASIHFGGLPNTIAELNNDQDDPFGVLIFYADTDADGSLSANELARFENRFKHTYSTYHTPLIVSAGPDGETGLFEPYDVQNKGHLAAGRGNTDPMEDNITNHNTRTGAD